MQHLQDCLIEAFQSQELTTVLTFDVSASIHYHQTYRIRLLDLHTPSPLGCNLWSSKDTHIKNTIMTSSGLRIIATLLICLQCTPASAGSSPDESRYVPLPSEADLQQQQQQHQREPISRNETNEYIIQSLPSLDFMLQEENDLASASSSSSTSSMNDQEKSYLRTSEIAGYEMQARRLASILAEQEQEKIEKRAFKSSLRKRNMSFELEIQELERQLEELEEMAGRS